jgi:polysaccharide pyruvyl transferase WcaK-like protein
VTPSKAAARKFERLKSYRTTVILLPQAFGPFHDPAIRDYFKRIADSAELIFARDEISLEHVRTVVGESAKLALAPDFTVLLEGTPPGERDWFAERLCVVPNARMIDKTSGKERSQYVEFLKRVVIATRGLGKEAFFLIHEGYADHEIARAVNGLLGKGCKIVYEQDPLLLKGILGASAAVVSSRYHALIGSLSQAVPSLCVGWSHKYRELFKSYEFSSGLVKLDATEDNLQEAILPLLEGEPRLRLVAHLRTASQRQKELAGEMWRRVFQCIGERHGGLQSPA